MITPPRLTFFLLLFTSASLYAAESGVPAPGMLGVNLHEILGDDVRDLSLPGEYGAKVQAVGPDSPAAEAGLRENDVIVQYNGQHVESARALRRMVLESPAGRLAELRIIRGGSPMLTQVTLGVGQLPATYAPAPRSLGVWVEPIAPAVAQYLEVPEGVGMIVREVKEGSPAANAGLQPRDVLIRIGETDIESAEGLQSTIQQLPLSSAEITFIRGLDSQQVTVQF
ncbi:MAG: PDZ domain-containing protein [Kiritimatiellia bacterium]